MKIKKIITILIVSLLLISSTLSVACNNKTKTETISINLVNEDGTAFDNTNVSVKLSIYSPNDHTYYLPLIVLDSEGKTTVTHDEIKEYITVDSTYAMKLVDLPDKYVYEPTNFTLSDKTVNVTIYNKPNNDFYDAERKSLPYKRIWTIGEDPNAMTLVDNTPYKFDAIPTSYTYLTFSPYVAPETVEITDNNEAEARAEIQRRINNATKIARGQYKISVSATKGTPILYHFVATDSYAITKENGVPSDFYIASGKAPSGEDENKYTGENSIIFNLSSDIVRGNIILGVYSDYKCEVTVTVERLGDSIETEYNTIFVDTTEELSAWTNPNSQEQLTLMPLDGSVETFYNESDGYYHVNNVNGPYLLVNFNKVIERSSSISIAEILTKNDSVKDVIKNSEYSYTIYDYSNFIRTYSQNCNSDGVYRVNQELYDFLQIYAAKTLNYSILKDKAWLNPCQFYSPVNGLPLSGEGTESSPYKLIFGTNTVDMTSLQETAVLRFTPNASAWYIVDTSANVTLPADVNNTKIDGKYYIELTGNVTYKFIITGNEQRYSFNISQVSKLMASVDGTTSSGTSEEYAYLLRGTGVYEVVIDTNISSKGFFLKYKIAPGATGEYNFNIFGDNALITYENAFYNSTSPLTLNISTSSQEFNMILSIAENYKVVNGSFLLQITRITK